MIALAPVAGRHYKRLTINNETKMADKTRVEHRINIVMIVVAAVRQAPNRRAGSL
jgi:hypothetical protein